MLQQRVNTRGGSYPADYGGIAAIISAPSFIDLNNEEPLGENQIAFIRLFKQGFITQKITEVPVPNVAGEYEGNMTGCYDVSLRIAEGKLPKVVGDYKVKATGCVASTPEQAGTFIGTLAPPNKLLLRFVPPITTGTYRFMRAELKITEDVLRLDGDAFSFSGGTYPLNLKGNGVRDQVMIKQFAYRFMPAFNNLVIKENAIAAGDIKIDRLENLLLASSVEADASFLWHVDFNRAAQALTGILQQNGEGKVIFRKQPDGRWVVWNYRLE